MLFALRVVLALAVFGISFSSVAKGYVTGPGLWEAFSDQSGYHQFGIDHAAAAERGIELRPGDGYTTLVGFAYSWIAAFPVIPILLNSVFDVAALVSVAVLIRFVTGAAAPTWLLWAFGLWPSWLTWSTQLLKESLLVTCCLVGLALSASILTRASTRSALTRYWFVEWPLLLVCVACIALLRPATADIAAVATCITAAWVLLEVARRRASWRSAVVAVAVALTAVQGRSLMRSVLVSVTPSETAYAYAQLAVAYEREGDLERADQAYRQAAKFDPQQRLARERLVVLREARAEPSVTPTGDARPSPATPQPAIRPGPPLLAADTGSPAAVPPTDSSAAVAPPNNPPLPIAPEVTVAVPAPKAAQFGTFRQRLYNSVAGLAGRVNLQGLAELRKANSLGVTQFSPNADISTVSGALRLLPVGLSHVLFGPFPSVVFGTLGSVGALRYFSLIEFPTVVAVVLLGFIGVAVSLRRPHATTILLLSFAATGIAALALTVPNDGLLFRYRLPFLASLVAFVPQGVQAVRCVLRRKIRDALTHDSTV